ncbi:hypothetical protein ACFYU8_26860 [Brevibacillus sp. NPDC003359]
MAIALVMTVVIPMGSVFVLLSAFMGWCNVSTSASVGYLVLAGLLVTATLGIVVSMRMLMQQVGTPDVVADQGTVKH